MLLSFVVGLLDKVEHVVDRTWRGGDLIFDIQLLFDFQKMWFRDR